LVEQTEFKDSWAKVAALREAGVLAFKMNDLETARRLFRRAIDSSKTVDRTNNRGALRLIAIAQVGAGDFDDALQTTALITNDESDHTRDGEREEAFHAVAVAMLKAGDTERAMRTAFSITRYVQYRDDVLEDIVDFHVRKRDLAAALTAAGKI